MDVTPLLPANDKILQALNLPPLYAITCAKKSGMTEFMPRLELALTRGVRLIQVREPDVAPAQCAQWARRIMDRAHAYGARVLVNGDETLARKVRADGVHSPARQLMRLTARPATRLWAASCHNTEELARAARLGADFVVLSPVLPTSSHPDHAAMGWHRFADLVRDYPLPVYALGGMRSDRLDIAMQHGAHGIACMSGIWLGVPVFSQTLNGLDSLLSIVPMPAGVPVATFAIGRAGAVNAGLFAAAILANKYPPIRVALRAFRAHPAQAVLARPDPSLPA